jgi:hypothetical protein
MGRLLLAVATALVLAASAQASSIKDLQSLGYTVKVVSQSQNCKLWVASGFGITKTLGCDGTSGFQANVDAMAAPETACDVKWQFNHKDQLSAVSQIDQLGYVVTADECAGHYTVANRYTTKSVYKGPGAGLVGLALKVPPAAPSATAMPRLVSTCLPLCQTVSSTVIQPSIAAGKVSVAVTVTLADVLLALQKRDKAAAEPLLSSAISSALGRKLVVTGDTACTIRDNPIDCGRLFNLISDTQVTVTFKGTTATAVGLPVPKVAANPTPG